MTLEFSDFFKEGFYSTLNKNPTIKDIIYDNIEYLDKNILLSDFPLLLRLYKEFLQDNTVNYFSHFRGKTSFYFKNKEGYSCLFHDFLKNEIVEHIKVLFKNKYNSNYISYADQITIDEYTSFIISKNNDNEDALFNKLKIKLGEPFLNFSEDWNRANISKLLHKMVVDFIDQKDSHRYNNEILDCFIKSAQKENFLENSSVCQYKMHGVDVLGEQSSDNVDL